MNICYEIFEKEQFRAVMMSKYMTRRTRDIYNMSISERPTKILIKLVYINKRKTDSKQSPYV